MDYEHIIYSKEGHIATITLNRPEVLNALRPQTVKEIIDAFLDFTADPDLWVMVMTGSGEKSFCVGADLKYMSKTGGDQAKILRAIDELAILVDRCDKPIICAINGYAVGGGLEMALFADIILAADHAKIGLPEVKRGLVADAGGLFRVPKRIPYHQAMGLILTGRFISGEQAQQMGLVNELVPQSKLKEATMRWAGEIIENSPLAVQAAKRIVKTFLFDPNEPDKHGYNQIAAVQKLRDSEDYLEGPKAFAEKRKPNWKGK